MAPKEISNATQNSHPVPPSLGESSVARYGGITQFPGRPSLGQLSLALGLLAFSPAALAQLPPAIQADRLQVQV